MHILIQWFCDLYNWKKFIVFSNSYTQNEILKYSVVFLNANNEDV